jgi:anti-sigma factor RsiW
MAETKPLPEDDDAETPTDELVAYLDGELDPKSAEAVAQRLSLDARMRAEADALQRTWDILDILPRSEPSPSFATRTVSQVIPLPSPFASRTMVVPGPSGASMAYPSPSRAGFWLAAMAIVLAAGIGGYFGHQAMRPSPKSNSVEPPVEDYSLMKNMRLYRNVDDIESVKQLDSPEMFGGEE